MISRIIFTIVTLGNAVFLSNVNIFLRLLSAFVSGALLMTVIVDLIEND